MEPDAGIDDTIGTHFDLRTGRVSHFPVQEDEEKPCLSAHELMRRQAFAAELNELERKYRVGLNDYYADLTDLDEDQIGKWQIDENGDLETKPEDGE